LELYAEAKKVVNIPILAGSRMNNPYMCAEALESGKADAFVLSRPALADPDLPRKVAVGKVEKIRPCIGCNQGCVGRLLEKGVQQTCAVNPRACREFYTPIYKTVLPKKVIIVGGGVAGMEVARTATMCGHEVVVFEKTDTLGGDLLAAGAHSFKHELLQLNDWYKGEMKDLKIDIRMNTEATPARIKAENPDTVILAVGASPVMPKSIPGIDNAKAITSIEALTGKKNVGERVVVVGGGNVGIELAIGYVMEGKRVVVVEAMDTILANGDLVPQQNKMWLNDAIEYYKLDVRTGTKLEAVTDEGAVVAPAAGGERVTIPADTVVCALGFRPNPSMAAELNGCGAEVFEVGNGKRPSNVIAAIGEAFEIARNL
jgi:2-enoate reductase